MSSKNGEETDLDSTRSSTEVSVPPGIGQGSGVTLLQKNRAEIVGENAFAEGQRLEYIMERWCRIYA